MQNVDNAGHPTGDIMTDSDNAGLTYEWVSVSTAAVNTGKSERTIRRWIASGKIKSKEAAGQTLVYMPVSDLDNAGHSTGTPDNAGQVPVIDIDNLKALLHEKDIIIARLEEQIIGKDAIIDSKDNLVDELRDTKRILAERIERSEILLQQLQRALPASSIVNQGDVIEAEAEPVVTDPQADLIKPETENLKEPENKRPWWKLW